MAAPVTREGSFVIIAEFEVKPDGLERFLALATADASQSVAKEPGCHQFDVTVDRACCTRSTTTRRRSTPICGRPTSRPSAPASSPWWSAATSAA